ncbi:hypothetical protein H4R19_005528 [Coemansia spiralis]|nr:hypothetical protein H4R19_005528 [Coemansia spiralis]
MSRRPKLLVLLPVLALTVIVTYVLCVPKMLPGGVFGGGSSEAAGSLKEAIPADTANAPSEAIPAVPAKPSGITYYLPVAQFTDSKWLRMNTVLRKAVRVCDKTTMDTVAKNITDQLGCDVTLEAERGWGKLCTKTRAIYDHLCKAGGLGSSEFFIKLDDDTLVDPRMEDYILRELSGRDVFFGFSPGWIRSFTKFHTWFGGPFYGFSASVLDKICACSMPDCPDKMGEDEWTGYMLGECNITKEDILLPKGFVYHRDYSSPRVSVEFHKLHG